MSDLGWRAEGIARARAVGGVELEKYRRPGFAGGTAVRRASDGGYVQGVDTGHDPATGDPTPEEFKRRGRRA